MSGNELVLRLAGEGGEGVISAGDIFAAGAAHLGHYLYTFRTYPAEIKGGHAWIQGRVSNRPVLSMGDHLDVLVAFDAEAYHRHHQLLKDGGVLVYDPDTVTPENGEFVTYAVPFNKIARKELDFLRGKNLVVLGVMSYLFGLKIDALESVVRKRLGRRSELLDQNLKALEYGFDYAKANLKKKDSHYISGGDGKQRLVMSGSDAIVAGALYAGCRFFAGYPITPASDIMESMARELPRLGGGFVQAEDEIAALGAAVGASYAGAKAMTATSGPGLSLMTEFLGLAGMAEIPVVVVDAQRAGPATGMPTKLEQGDLNHALYGGHGDFPRVVIASASVEDSLY
ncbi:MAG: 2-oxoacid:acceptor oxidoreductase family protein, partial [Chloroflexi bacterium]|nr:2-oxoacid:acceptor oxidoreductase family protein [Chloroflexota bacterium]